MKKTSLFGNTLAQSTALVTGYLTSFLLAPIMLAQLGLELFGVWAVTGAIATYAVLLDFGITRSLARFIALYDARGDERAIRETLGLGLGVCVAMGVIIFPAAALSAPLITDLLGHLSVSEMRLVLLGAAGIFVLRAFRAAMNTVGVGMRRMVPGAVATTSYGVFNFAVSVAVLLIEPTLPAYAVANALAEFVGIGFSAVALRRVWPGASVALPSRARVSEIFGFGLRIQVSWIADLVNMQTDKIVIAVVAGVRAAAAYELGSRVVLALRAVGLLTVSAMIPTATASIVERGREVIPDFYRRYTRRAVALAFPILTMSCISTPFLLVAWLGERPDKTQPILIALALAYFVNMTMVVASTIAIGDGRPEMQARNAVLTAVANVVLTVGLAPLFGVWGVLAGTFVAIAGGALLFVRRFHRAYSLPLGDFTRAVVPPAALALGLGIPFAAIAAAVGVPDTRPVAAIAFVATVGPYGLAYWLVASALDWLPRRLTAPWAARRVAADGVAG